MAKNTFEEIKTKNFPNLSKKTDIQVQGAHRVPNKINPKRSTQKHFVIKVAKIKDKGRLLKAEREKQLLTYNGTHNIVS